MTQIFLVSDLHLGAVPPSEDDAYSGAFARFVHHLADEHDAGTVVLLGDTFDLLRVGERLDSSARSAIEKLRRLCDQHRAVVEALQALRTSGWQLEMVVGNHDAELAIPEVVDELKRLLPGVRVWPWLFNVDGLLHAEHGHQHHDINAVLEPLGPAAGRPVRLPLASHLSDKRALFAAAATRRRPWSGHEDEVRRAAPSLGLPPEVAVDLDRLAARSTRRMVARVLAKAAGRAGATAYMERAAARVHEVRSGAGVPVAYYVFGHTHRAESLPLGGGGTYLNCGTWTPFVPEDLPRPWLTTVRVAPSTPAEVLRWDDVAVRLLAVTGEVESSTS